MKKHPLPIENSSKLVKLMLFVLRNGNKVEKADKNPMGLSTIKLNYIESTLICDKINL